MFVLLGQGTGDRNGAVCIENSLSHSLKEIIRISQAERFNLGKGIGFPFSSQPELHSIVYSYTCRRH